MMTCPTPDVTLTTFFALEILYAHVLNFPRRLFYIVALSENMHSIPCAEYPDLKCELGFLV